MSLFDLAGWLVPGVVGALAAVALTLILIHQVRVPQTGPVDRLPSTWYAHLLTGVGWPYLGELGVLRIADGMLTYTANGSAAPAWRHPLDTVRAQHRGFQLGSPATVDLLLPGGERLAVEVSRQRIRPWLRSNLDGMFRPRAAHDFLRTLAAYGADCRPEPTW